MHALFNNPVFRQIIAIFSQKKTARFASVAAIGAFIGSMIGYQLGGQNAQGLFDGVLRISAWDACVGVGIGIAISLIQSLYMRVSPGFVA
ncbi:MAG: hypothetical protein HQL80_11245 [Magnetococcales bacterium]|nr:hypothetical protein [Magnetococcales bacterium]